MNSDRENETPLGRIDPDMLRRLMELEETNSSTIRGIPRQSSSGRGIPRRMYQQAVNTASDMTRMQNNNWQNDQTMPQNPIMPQNPMTNSKCDQTHPYPLPFAMVYSPRQCFINIYEPDEALSRGTLFKDLDFPFMMASCTRGGGIRG